MTTSRLLRERLAELEREVGDPDVRVAVDTVRTLNAGAIEDVRLQRDEPDHALIVLTVSDDAR